METNLKYINTSTRQLRKRFKVLSNLIMTADRVAPHYQAEFNDVVDELIARNKK